MCWRGGSGWPRGFGFIAVLAAGTLAVGAWMSGAYISGAQAAQTSPPGSAAAAVVHQVSAAAQRDTLAYWTQARMSAALPGGLARAAGGAGAGGPGATAAGGAAGGAAPRVVAPPKGTPTAVHFTGVPTTGALFSTTGRQAHFCTASVVDSTIGDLVLTAAHCVYSNSLATNIEYVPEYHNGHQPFGAWTVRTITVAAGWQKSHDPDLDFAFLMVSSASGRKIQAVTGGLRPGFTRWYRETIEVIGYNDPDSEPIRCLTNSFRFRTGQMEFYCRGYRTGTSGGPWIIGYNAKTGTGTVFGVIGGYEQGGVYDWASYSSYFGSALRILYGQAENQPLSGT